MGARAREPNENKGCEKHFPKQWQATSGRVFFGGTPLLWAYSSGAAFDAHFERGPELVLAQLGIFYRP